MSETEGLIPRPTDVIGQLEYEIDKGGNSATVNAMIEAAVEIRLLRGYLEDKTQRIIKLETENTMRFLEKDELTIRAERAESALAEAVAAEREACAKIAESAWIDHEIDDTDLDDFIAAAIRARRHPP